MTDIFDNTILCNKCNIKMIPFTIEHNGFILRAVKCSKCNSKIVHPRDNQDYQDFLNLRRKEFIVKMRFVGNSYAISIPKEIVNFIKEQEKIADDMVKLCFEESGRISINFCNGNNHRLNSVDGSNLNTNNGMREKR